MLRTTIVAMAFAVLAAALTATVLASPSGAAHRKYTLAFAWPASGAEQNGGADAAKKLGVRYIVPTLRTGSEQDQIRAYKKLIARHVDAIAAVGYDPAVKSTFKKVRKAGILLISSGDDIDGRRDLWVNQCSAATYARALADALASQVHGKGEYAVLEQQGEYPVADTWGKLAAAYIAKAYPKMKSDGVLDQSGSGAQADIDAVKSFMSAHPNLKGLIGITPTEAQMAASAIEESGRIGQVFSSGNGGSGLGWKGSPLPGWVRTGVAQFVFTSNPIKLGYLTVWGAHYLLTGHHFTRQAYHVGGPIGLVWYYPEHQELRLDEPLTITKKNVNRFAKKF